MSSSIPVENIRKINDLEEIPYKDLRNYKVKQNYDNQLQYLSTLNIDEVSNQIEQDINDYNNYIDFIISKNNRITNKVKTEYNNLLTKLTADRDYINTSIEEDGDIEEEENDINTIDSSIFNNQENNFNDDAISTYNEIDNYKKIENINDLLSFTDVEYEITFVDDEDNYNIETKNVKQEVSEKLIVFYKKVDKAIEEYNNLIDRFKNNKLVTIYKFNDAIRKIKKLARRFKYYYYPKIEKSKIYPVYSVYYNGYSDEFNKMLYNDFNDKYQKFKVENINTKGVFMIFRYYYLYDISEWHSTPMVDYNFLKPENIFSGKAVYEINKAQNEIACSDSTFYKTEKPMVESIYSFEFLNAYEELKKNKNLDESSTENSEEYYNSEELQEKLDELAEKMISKRTNRDGEFFTYKINRKAFEKYFGEEYAYHVIDVLYKYQIFEEFNPFREEYRYNCLMYSLYRWFFDNVSKEDADEICNLLSSYNLSRLVTSKDIKEINKILYRKYKEFGGKYKIINYAYNPIENKLHPNAVVEDPDVQEIPIALVNERDFPEKDLKINHYIIFEQVKFNKLKASKEKSKEKKEEEILRKINDLKSSDSNQNNWQQLSSYTLIKYLLNNDKGYEFFIPFTDEDIIKLFNQEDEFKNRLKNMELYQIINMLSDFQISMLQSKAFIKKVLKDKIKKINNHNDLDRNVGNIIKNDVEYEKLCIYDFEASTHELNDSKYAKDLINNDTKNKHKPYMVCYTIMDYPKNILNKAELENYIKSFKLKDIKVLFNDEESDCATKFLEVIPDKTLCYAHNARYDISFFVYDKIKIINPIEKDGNFYSTDIVYKNKLITIKDSYRIISSKLKNFSDMFKLCSMNKDAFPFKFFTQSVIEKYKDKFIKVKDEEFYKFYRINFFNGYSIHQKLKNMWDFKNEIINRCDGVFNVINYLDEYYQNTIVKEVFPYNFYTIENLKKYDKDYDINSEEFKKFEKDLKRGFNQYSKEDEEKLSDIEKKLYEENANKLYEEFRKVIIYKFNGVFNMNKYSEFYCKRDVEILTKGLIHFRTSALEILKLDCFKELTISSMAHKYMINNVYSQTGDEDIYTTSGVLNQYIQSAVYGGVCATYKNGKAFIKQIVSDFDKVSLYPSAISRLWVVTGKCRKFHKDELEEINDSMISLNGEYDNQKCWLLKHTNKEDEFDKNKINMYVVTIKITDSKIVRDNPRILVKNELVNGKLKYPNLESGSMTVNVKKDVNLNNLWYKHYYVNECIVTVDNIMLEDYIKYHDIEFEVLGGVYWKNSERRTLHEIFTTMNNIKKQLRSKKMNKEEHEEDRKKLLKELWKCEEEGDLICTTRRKISTPYWECVHRYSDIKKELHELKKERSKLIKNNKLTNEIDDKRNKLKDELNEINQKIYELDNTTSETKSSKQQELIRKVINHLFDERVRYKAEGNPLQEVIKLVLNSIYGKTIQKPTNKKIHYVEVLTDIELNLLEVGEKRQKYIIKQCENIKNNCMSKLNYNYAVNKITENEYKEMVNKIDNMFKIENNIYTSTYSPIKLFMKNNKNRIIDMQKINDNMYRIETVEQIEKHKSFNHIGVQILSMSKRIMNELICLSQDNNIRIYYQDTDSIHIEDKYIDELAEKYEKEYNKKLTGNEFHQFHPDFEACKLLNGDKAEKTLADLSIINAKKNYCDRKIGVIDETKKFNKRFKEPKYIGDIRYEINKNSFDSYHPRMKGVSQECIPFTASKNEMKIEELYLAGFNNNEYIFDISKIKPCFKFQKDFSTTTENLARTIKSKGNRYVIDKNGIEHVILDNKENRKNVTVDIEGNIIGEVINESKD